MSDGIATGSVPGLRPSNNLSDVPNDATARTNLGLGGAATLNVGTAAGTVAAGDHGHVAANVSDFSEAVDDRVATLLQQGSNVTLTYNDAANTLTIAAAGGGGLTVQEVDGTPSVAATTLLMPNGTLTDNGGGSVTYTPGASGGGSTITVGTNAASRPASPSADDQYQTTDAFIAEEYSGSAWEPYGPRIYMLGGARSLSAAGWAWINQGTATISIVNNQTVLYAPPSSGHSLRVYKRALAAASNYTLVLGMVPQCPVVGSQIPSLGLVLRNSGSGSLVSWGYAQSNAASVLCASKYTNATTFSADYARIGFSTIAPMLFLSIQDDGTNRKCGWGIMPDPTTHQILRSDLRTDYITPDEWGIYVNNINTPAGTPSYMFVLYLKES